MGRFTTLVKKLRAGQFTLEQLGATRKEIRRLRDAGYKIKITDSPAGRLYTILTPPPADDIDPKLVEALQTVEMFDGNVSHAARHLNIPRQTLSDRYDEALKLNILPFDQDGNPKEARKITETENDLTIDYRGTKIKTPDELLRDSEIDLEVWEVVEVVINNWEVGGKIHQGQVREKDTTRWLPQSLWKTSLRQIKIRLRRKSDERRTIEHLLELLEAKSPVVPKIERPAPFKESPRRCLEVAVMDPHYGLLCFPPGADKPWSLEDCRSICMWAVDSLLKLAEGYGPLDSIVFPFGNDFMHVDNLQHTTTGGTTMGDAVAYHHVYAGAEDLAIAMIERLKQAAPVHIYEIPGNHDRQTAYTLGRLLRAYYRNDANVTVNADASPYKFHRFGTNLIGFDHGHSIPVVRLAALMANECPEDWAETSYREWHLGDQHRKGGAIMEEQGVSVEYLPSITPPNDWHRLKSFNWQKRGAVAYVWDHDQGQIARLNCNLNSYTGRPTGQKV